MGPRRKFTTEVDGLNYNERLARLEGCVFGDGHQQLKGLDAEHDDTRKRLEELESGERRRKMPWYLRWFLKRGDR